VLLICGFIQQVTVLATLEFCLNLTDQVLSLPDDCAIVILQYLRPQHGAEYTIEELNSVEWKCGSTPQVWDGTELHLETKKKIVSIHWGYFLIFFLMELMWFIWLLPIRVTYCSLLWNMLPMFSNNLVLDHFNNIAICLKTVTSNQLLVITESYECGKTSAVIWEGQLFFLPTFLRWRCTNLCT
jgi:hypothetical protein